MDIINDLSSSGNNLRIVNDVTHVANFEGYYSFEFVGSADYLKLNSASFNDLSDGTNSTIVILVNLCLWITFGGSFYFFYLSRYICLDSLQLTP